jgi:hypothetical protein
MNKRKLHNLLCGSGYSGQMEHGASAEWNLEFCRPVYESKDSDDEDNDDKESVVKVVE